ncbi:MAG: RNA polymerase sigma factor [Cellulosilyticaceae bacterium]
MQMNEWTDDECIELIKNYEQEMYRVARGILKHEEDCEDAVQETILRAYKGMSHVKEKQYFKTWLLRITINESTRIYKKRKFFACVQDVIELTQRRDIEGEMDLHKVIEMLPKKYKEPLVLYYFGDCTYEEVASVLQIPVGTVRSRLYYAKDRLKKQLEGGSYERREGIRTSINGFER